MIKFRIDIGREAPLPEIPSNEPGPVLPGSRDVDTAVLLATSYFGPPQEPVLSIEGRVKDLDLAASLVNAVATALEHANLREAEAEAKGDFG